MGALLCSPSDGVVPGPRETGNARAATWRDPFYFTPRTQLLATSDIDGLAKISLQSREPEIFQFSFAVPEFRLLRKPRFFESILRAGR